MERKVIQQACLTMKSKRQNQIFIKTTRKIGKHTELVHLMREKAWTRIWEMCSEVQVFWCLLAAEKLSWVSVICVSNLCLFSKNWKSMFSKDWRKPKRNCQPAQKLHLFKLYISGSIRPPKRGLSKWPKSRNRASTIFQGIAKPKENHAFFMRRNFREIA